MKIKKYTIERVEIIGYFSESDDAFHYLQENKFRVIRSGPKPKGDHMVSVRKFLIIADRELTEDSL